MALSRIAFTLAAGLVATSLTGCLGDSTDFSGDLDEALHYVPAGSIDVRFVDHAAVAKRLGVEDVDPSDEESMHEYVDAMVGSWGSTILGSRLTVMADAPFNETDVQWEISASGDSGPTAYVWKVADDFDMSALADSLDDAGYEKDEASGLDRYTAELTAGNYGGYGGIYPLQMTSVALDDAHHLVLGAFNEDRVAEVAEVVAGDADSVAKASGNARAVADDATDAEYAHLVDGSGACWSPGGDPEKVERLNESYADLGHPTARAFALTADAATGYLWFSDAGEAQADASARERLLADGTDPAGVPFTELGTFTIHVQDSTERITEEWHHPLEAPTADAHGSGPTFCLGDA